MGPRLADFIGLDVCHDIMMVLYRELGTRSSSRARCFGSSSRRETGDKSGRDVYEH